MEEQDLETYFSEDLALGLIPLDRAAGLVSCAREARSRIQASDREHTQLQRENALRTNYQQHNNSLLQYQPRIDPVFEPPSRETVLRQRLCITLQREGKALSLQEFMGRLQQDIDMTTTLLEEKDRELFEVKYVKRLTDLEQECEKAVMQIDDRMYAKTLEDRYDQVSCFGIAFYKKRCLIQKK